MLPYNIARLIYPILDHPPSGAIVYLIPPFVPGEVTLTVSWTVEAVDIWAWFIRATGLPLNYVLTLAHSVRHTRLAWRCGGHSCAPRELRGHAQ